MPAEDRAAHDLYVGDQFVAVRIASGATDADIAHALDMLAAAIDDDPPAEDTRSEGDQPPDQR